MREALLNLYLRRKRVDRVGVGQSVCGWAKNPRVSKPAQMFGQNLKRTRRTRKVALQLVRYAAGKAGSRPIQTWGMDHPARYLSPVPPGQAPPSVGQHWCKFQPVQWR
jgi:hypothetical protein